MAKPFYSADSYNAQRSIGCLLRRLTNLMLPRAEARFADKELSFTHWVILMCLRDGIADTCADIARHMSYDSGAITRLVDQLEKRGFVARTRSTTDRRVVHLAMTAEGEAATKALTPSTMNFWNEMLEGFSPTEAEMLIALLTRLLAKMEKTPVTQDEAA
jgi:DNA-binding MarR family transcriptional regulator